MLKKAIYFITSLTLALSMLAIASPAYAAIGSRAGAMGIVVAIDTVGNTITIAPQNGGTNLTLNVNSKTLITRNGIKRNLTALQLGDKVTAKYEPVTLVAATIVATFKLSLLVGTVAYVDHALNTVYIMPKFGNSYVMVYTDLNTIIKRDGVRANAVKAGDKVKVQYNPTTMLAITILTGKY